jgi:Protein of unknown function (DUF3102)
MVALTGKIVGFNYEAIESSLRRPTQQDATAIRDLTKRTGANIIEIGKRLLDVRQRLGKAQFGAWLRAELQWPQSTASKYMTAAERFGDIGDCLEQFQPHALFELSYQRVPVAAVERSIAKARSGEPITRRVAQELVSSIQPIDTGHTPLSRDAVRRLRSSLNQMADQIDTIVTAMEPADLDGLVDQLFDVAARLRAARKAPAPSPRKSGRRRVVEPVTA